MQPQVTTQVTPATWWRGRWFVRLLAVRLTGQAGDGVFQGALASYVLFSDDQATAAELAVVAAVVLLPWSLLGPSAGVALDRWSRRQVLLVGNLGRSLVLLLLAGIVLAGLPDPWVYAAALAALAVNRFLLAGLSASLPHTVPVESLTAANAVTPTAGTGAFVAGLALAGVLRGGVLTPVLAEEAVLIGAAATYLAAAALALRLPRGVLGPDHGSIAAAAARPGLVIGLVAGVRHLRSRPWPAAALAALGGMRLFFGLATVSAVLTLRNTADDDAAALSALSGFTLTTAAGFLAAALVAPVLARHRGRGAAMVTALGIAALGPLAPAVSPQQGAWLVAGAVLGLGAQVTKICVDAVLQAGVDDDVRGRVFSLHDMVFNVAFVVAAASAVVLLPAGGRSVPVLLGCSVGLVVLAVALGVALRRHPAPAAVSGVG